MGVDEIVDSCKCLQREGARLSFIVFIFGETVKENTIQMMSKTLTHIGKRSNPRRTNERNWNKFLANVRFELLNCGLFNE